MNTKKTKASSSDFDSLLGGSKPETAVSTEPKKVAKKVAPKTEVVKSNRGRPAVKGNDVQTSFYYPAHWRKRLKEQALHEDVSVNDLVLEGIHLMFAKRGIDLKKLDK